MVKKEELRTIVADYLRKRGYLTSGFVGNGPIKIEFDQQKTLEEPVVVGLRESGGGSFSKAETVAVRIEEESKREADFITASDYATAMSANRCFIARSTRFDEDDREIASQGGVGLLEIEGKSVKEVVPAKLTKSRGMILPKSRFDGLKLAQQLLKFGQKDLEHLARVFCRAEVAFVLFNVGDIFVGFRKESGLLEVKIVTWAGPLVRSGTYVLKFGEFVGFLVNPSDDRYTFVDKLGDMFVFRPEEWRFLLRVLSKVDLCCLTFYVGTAKVDFFKDPGQKGLDLCMEIRNEPPLGNGKYEHHYTQDDLGTLTKKRRRKEKQAITSSEGS